MKLTAKRLVKGQDLKEEIEKYKGNTRKSGNHISAGYTGYNELISMKKVEEL